MKEALQTSIEGGVEEKRGEAKDRVGQETEMLKNYPHSPRAFANGIATKVAYYAHFRELL